MSQPAPRTTPGRTACLYARVSTSAGQDPELQLAALRAHAAQRGLTIVEEYRDVGFSGALERRPALDRLMKDAWAGRFQVVLVWRFDRFARSVKHLIRALEEFRSLGIAFVSMQEQLDTSSPIGHAMFTIIGAMAQLERDIIRERVKAGVDRAREQGKRLGRPRRHIVDVAEARRLLAEGHSLRAAARSLTVPHTSLRRALAAGCLLLALVGLAAPARAGIERLEPLPADAAAACSVARPPIVNQGGVNEPAPALEEE